jgi:large subunit ribosomal protein L33
MTNHIILICSVCLSRNYPRVTKGGGIQGKRLELKKYCPRCNRATLHKESK